MDISVVVVLLVLLVDVVLLVLLVLLVAVALLVGWFSVIFLQAFPSENQRYALLLLRWTNLFR